ncbi:MAG: nitrilase-related carbon-nitrogen hydrolase [Pseudobdellovibrionaceae bacterium]
MSASDSLLHICSVQMNAVDDIDINLQSIINNLDQSAEWALQQGHDLENLLVCFPENALYFRIISEEAMPFLDLQGPQLQLIQKWVDQKKSYVHLGSVPLKIKDRIYSSSVFFAPGQSPQASYQKMHLFDIQLQGQKPILESDVFAHGPAPSIIQIKDWKLGESICYDIRFAELYNYYAKNNVDVLLIPAAFLQKTGQAHWEVLCRARAIESQAFVVATGQVGAHKSQKANIERHTFGQSMIVDPWGQVITVADQQNPQIITATLSKNKIQQVRQQIPMSQHRRGAIGGPT